MKRPFTFALALLIAPASLAAPQDVSVYHLLRGIADATQSAQASQQLERFLHGVVSDALAAETPAFCPAGGQGGIDAIALRDFALMQAPTTSDQTQMGASALVTAYLAQEYPCG